MPKKKDKAPTAVAPQGISGVHLDGKHAVLKAAEGHHVPVVRRVVLCDGGFGCSPATLGTAVFGMEIATRKKYRFDRPQFERLATDTEVEEAEAFYNRNGFAPVCKRHERGLKLLLMVGRGTVLRLLRHEKDGTYRLFIYACKDDAWELNAAGGAPAAGPDELLLEINKRLRN